MTHSEAHLSHRSAVEAAIQRATAGCDAPAGLAGLDLGPYADGGSAMDYLVHPSWKGTPKDVWLRVVDWFVDAGADASLAFERALAIQLPFIAHHLATRGVLHNPADALRTAVVGRELGVARALVAGGADVSAVADLVRADLVTPARVEVQYRASDEQQRVTVTVCLFWSDAPFDRESILRHVSTSFQRLGEVGGLGGDLYAPATSRVTEASFHVREVGPSTFEAESVLRVRCVAPAAVAMLLRNLVSMRTRALPTAVSIVGGLPLDATDCSVDTARALRWLEDPSLDPLRPFEGSVPVSSKAKKKVFAAVDHAPGVSRDVRQAIARIDVEQLLRPDVVGFDQGEVTPQVHFDAKEGNLRTEILLKAFGSGVGMGDRTQLRALVQNVVSAVSGVTAVTWCDDAGVPVVAREGDVEKTPTARKSVAAQRPAKAAPAGSLYLSRLRDALAALREPPWAVGKKKAVKRPIPAAFSDGTPLPPSLAAWLAFADPSQPLVGKDPFGVQPFSALIGALFSGSEEMVEAFAPLEERLFPGACVPLHVPEACSDLTTLFLYLPLVDATGEAPVIGFDYTDDGLIGVYAPSFEAYLSRVLGVTHHPTTFGDVPGARPFVDALLASLPASLRASADAGHGILYVGPLV